MKRHVKSPHRGACLSPTDPRLLGNPLDFIAEDHLRERAICLMIDQISAPALADPDSVAHVLSFLSEELPLHLADEDEDLFPLMRRRCDPEDEIETVIDRLQADHGHAETDSPKIIALLRACLSRPGGLSGDDRAALSSYAAQSRRHLIVENAIILPIARARLSEPDLDRLRLGMLRRRGLDRAME